MKITGFCPMIMSWNSEEAIKVFESLGFEKAHSKNDIDVTTVSYDILKHPDGYSINILHGEHIDGDISTIQMNVDDFEEAYNELKEKGFTNVFGEGGIARSASSIECLMQSPSGYTIGLCQHLK